MKFTGERYIPGEKLDSEIVTEHLQRYLSIANLVKGKVVVDAASGAGYGSDIMADEAAVVIGLDLSGEAVSCASSTYQHENLKYLRGSIAALPVAENAADVVVSFETIEHVDGDVQYRFLKEIKRVLKDDGLLIISTPDKKTYSDLPNYHNEFHVKEFYRDEFREFLSSSFNYVELYDQFDALAYVLCHRTTDKLDIVQLNGQLRNRAKYLIALCSDEVIDKKQLSGTVVIDQDEKYWQKVNRVVELQGEIVEKNKVISWLEGVVEQEKHNAIARDGVVDEKTEIISRLRSHAEDLQKVVDKALEEHLSEQERADLLEKQLLHIHSTKAWKIIQKIYWLKEKIW